MDQTNQLQEEHMVYFFIDIDFDKRDKSEYNVYMHYSIYTVQSKRVLYVCEYFAKTV